MTFQKRLLRAMRRHNMRVADLARHLDIPYTTLREWVVFKREPSKSKLLIEKLKKLE